MKQSFAKIPSPEEYFGFRPGSDYHMIHWNDLCAYYRLLNEKSDRMKLVEVGPTSEGNDFLMLYVSAPENLANLEQYRQISNAMADPRGLSDEEIDRLASEGKAVCMQSYGLHSNEVGGPQMVPIMLYDLLTAESGDLLKILENVIFIISPCSEPDGEIIFTDWYHKYLGTEYEGHCSPYLRHNWAGHSNNRDSLREAVIESTYLNDVLIREWKPQAFQDHHHACPDENRMSIAPTNNPFYPAISPLVQREASVFGAEMACALSMAGRKGVVSGDEFYNSYPITTFYSNSQLHNTVGMLTENADVRIATPNDIEEYQLAERVPRVPTAQCPDPWLGGEWHLSDIVEQMYIASMTVLKVLARDPKYALKAMAKRALAQTKRGAESKEQAYLIPIDQHDPSALRNLLQQLQAQQVEMYSLKEDTVFEGKIVRRGSVVVPLAQPYYAVVETYLNRIPYPTGKYNLVIDGAMKVFDTANVCVAGPMGISVFPAMRPIRPEELVPVVLPEEKQNFPLPVNENNSYHVVNRALLAGKRIWRDEAGNFYDEAGENRHEIGKKKIGLLKKSETYNEEEGFTRNLLRRYAFDYRIVMDKEIRENGVPEDIDVLILPGDRAEQLLSGDEKPLRVPPEKQSGLGTNGAKNLVSFVENGGTLIAWEHACEYVDRVFALQMKVPTRGLPMREYATNGSLIRTEVLPHKLTRGMPERCSVTHFNGPVFYSAELYRPWYRPEVCMSVVKREDQVCENGYVKGEKYLAGSPCITRIPDRKGEIILYAFNPQFRIQHDGTFKVLFNALYEENL